MATNDRVKLIEMPSVKSLTGKVKFEGAESFYKGAELFYKPAFEKLFGEYPKVLASMDDQYASIECTEEGYIHYFLPLENFDKMPKSPYEKPEEVKKCC